MEVIIGKISNSCEKVENEIRELARKVELIIVLADNKNLNTNKLYDLSLRECSNAMIVENIEQLYINYIKRFKTVGIISDMTTSNTFIEDVIKIIKNTETEGYMYEHNR